MKKLFMISLLGAAFWLAGLFQGILPAGKTAEALAKDDLSFFKRKTIVLIVSTRPGGDYDFFGRLVAKGMQKHLPGSTVIVKNVPGGGMVIGANEIYKAAPNGLTFGTFNSGIIVAQLTRSPGVHFDLAKFTWLGNAAVFPRFIARVNHIPRGRGRGTAASAFQVQLPELFAGFGVVGPHLPGRGHQFRPQAVSPHNRCAPAGFIRALNAPALRAGFCIQRR